ncbi:MAG TPA: hypothetical protein VFH68_25030 [Polyangia bacterium]|nr:hypothetical protein [Polyangia bacterium]
MVVMTMIRIASLVCSAALLAAGCATKPRAATSTVDCAQGDAYEFLSPAIFDFTAAEPGWFQYADATPGGSPDLTKVASNIRSVVLDPPGRCGDTNILKLQASGHNFYGTGFGDYFHNSEGTRAHGPGYDGISFWARSPGNTDKTFLLSVDDGQTIVLRPPAPDGGGLPDPMTGDQDLDGDGFIGPGDIVFGTRCRLPAPQTLVRVACYNSAAQPPASATRVPEPDECGNQFHAYVTTTDEWQLFLLPWDQLVQWPCPNRLPGGIDPTDIAGFTITFIQGSTYDLWLDNIAFYRRRLDAGSGN